MPDNKRRFLVPATLILAGMVGAAAGGLVLARPDTSNPVARPPAALPVETRSVVIQDSFTMQRTFSGWVQARRESVLGFESGGRLSRVLVDEGEIVGEGELLAELDTQRLRAKRAELVAARAEAEANLALANVTLKRLRGVVDKGGVSRQGLDEAREAQRAARAALALAEKRIATMDIELEKTRLHAPFAAIVVSRAADEGRVLDAGHPVLTLQESSTPEVRVGVAGGALSQLEPGRIYPLAWGDGTLHARLRALLPLRAATARTVDALFDPVDAPDQLLPGDLVTLMLDSRIEQRGSWLPLTALAEGERGLWSVYVVDALPDIDVELGATHRIQRRTVDVIHQGADRVFVRSALSEHQHVVVAGLQRVVPGQLVRLAEDAITLAEVRHD
ncbi:MAG: efflux RND transporter periplasmic adaptor subunit [Gammaproteobacteria bacterium]